MNAHRMLLATSFLLFLVGCDGTKNSRPNGSAATQSSPANDPMFLGLPQDQTQKYPKDSALRDISMVMKVEIRPYDDYLEAKKDGHLFKDLPFGQWQYWARESMIDVPLPDGKRAWTRIVERFKSRLPATTRETTTAPT